MMDEEAYADLEQANHIFVNALKGWKAPTGLRGVWKTIAVESTSEQRKLGLERAAQSQAHKDDILARVVTRDPCPYCGTRLDRGQHTRGRGCKPL